MPSSAPDRGDREKWEELYACGSRPNRPPSRWVLDTVVPLPNDLTLLRIARGVGRAMLHNHLRHCATQAIRSGDDAQAEAMYDEIMELVYRSVR